MTIGAGRLVSNVMEVLWNVTISLDQEKAYDKIDHEYLWDILKEYGFPIEFVNLIKAMYSKAKTSIMVNGVIPAPIR